jgi:hypothetical protein
VVSATDPHGRNLGFLDPDDNLLERLNLLTLHNRRRHSNAFSGAKCCSSVLKTVGLRVPARNMGNFTVFSCSSSHCPSARCVSASNAVCKLINTALLRIYDAYFVQFFLLKN